MYVTLTEDFNRVLNEHDLLLPSEDRAILRSYIQNLLSNNIKEIYWDVQTCFRDKSNCFSKDDKQLYVFVISVTNKIQTDKVPRITGAFEYYLEKVSNNTLIPTIGNRQLSCSCTLETAKNCNNYSNFTTPKSWFHPPCNSSQGVKKENLKDMENTNFEFGPIRDNSIQISPYGLAIKNEKGDWISYNVMDGSIITVTGFVFNLDRCLFKVPVALNQVQKGDIVIYDRMPVYVKEVAADGKQLTVVDIRKSEIKNILPPTNMFGFNFITKVVNIFNFQATTPDLNNPFGNIMPYLLMSSFFNSENESGPWKFAMYNMMQNNGQNPFESLFAGMSKPEKKGN